MKIKTGYPSSCKILEANWKLVPELISNKNTALFVAIFLGVVMKELLGFIFPDIGFKIYKQLYFLLLIIPIHELLHILFFPYNSETIIWVNLKKLFICVTSDREFSRTRLMISLLAPLIVLTLLPLIVCIWYESQILIYILLYNALASGGDILSFIALASNKGSRFIINGDKLYTQDQF